MIRSIIVNILNFISNSLIKLIERINIVNDSSINLNSLNDLNIVKETYDDNLRCLTLIIKNNGISVGTHNLEETIIELFNVITSSNNYSSFGRNKALMLIGILENSSEYSLHHNIYLNSNSNYKDYYNQVKENLELGYEEVGYRNDFIPYFKVRIWNLDNYLNNNIKLNNKINTNNIGVVKRCYSTKASDRSYINPLLNEEIKLKSFGTLDIETVLDVESGKQVPYVITLTHSFLTKCFRDTNLTGTTTPNIINQNNLFSELIDYLIERKINNIFVHNLGAFDGYFIYKGLINLLGHDADKVSTLIDAHNKFIIISYKYHWLRTLDPKTDKDRWTTIKFIDSYRIFPVSLNDLCKNFGVEGKVSNYNQDFNNLELLKGNIELFSKFITYAKQDSLSLYEALFRAQEIYNNNFNIDIVDVLSTSTLSLKIFRKRFLKIKIPILKSLEDMFIRESYFGGATDFYKAIGKLLYYFDVNSLYPYAMKKPMPLNLIKKYNKEESQNIKLTEFFGFLKVKVTCTKNSKLVNPMLPCKYQGKTIFPYGSWIGTYFSEELKAMLPLGYKFEILEAMEFDKCNLFSDFINHFYEIKKNSTGSNRFIAKLHLNTLYGYFGRKQDNIITITVKNVDLPYYILNYRIKNIININDHYSSILIIKENDIELNKYLNVLLSTKILNNKLPLKFNSFIMSNVAIASAVTAYARIHMIQFKNNENCFYTDTDSIFTNKPLDLEFIGKDLGQMKDELDGVVIDLQRRGIFLGIKKYGYQYQDSLRRGVLTDKSVISGVERDTISFVDIENVFNGKTIFPVGTWIAIA